MTLLAASVFVESPTQLAADAERAFGDGADAVELRIDGYDGDPAALAAYLRAHPDRRWIVTCRSAEEGGHFRGDTMERVSRLIAVARGTDAFVDFELADWRRSANIQQKVLLAAARSDGAGHRLILSAHDFQSLPNDVEARVGEMGRTPGVVASKVAYHSPGIIDSFKALDLMHANSSGVVAIAMGECGLWTRVLAKKLGAFASYAALDADRSTAPGQVTVRELRERYRWDRLRESTKVYGVMGDPVAHSMGPAVFNRWFHELGVDAVYLPLRVGRGEGEVEQFLNGCQGRPWSDVRGLSVTIPHKAAALRWAGDGADRLAQRIGAANTLVMEGGTVRAFNTDCYAAIASIAASLGCATTDLAGVPVDVLGGGGSAAAVIVGLLDGGCRVTVFARSPAAVRADGGVVRSWADRGHGEGAILIHCTPLGMTPDVNATPMTAEALARYRLVFDLIYNPAETRLLREAAQAGCRTLNGLDMYYRQAAMQFELWTGRIPLCPPLERGEVRSPPPLPRGDRGGVSRSRRIILIGMRGSGKTTVGRELARQLGSDHVDLDDLVVARVDRSIADIFAAGGEAEFRRHESAALADVLQSPPSVLSVGGGAILDERNAHALRRVATVVWLTASPELLWERVQTDAASRHSRPALTTLEGMEELRAVLVSRRAIYARTAHMTVETSGQLPADVAVEILRRLDVHTP